jgi:hypothetical protein
VPVIPGFYYPPVVSIDKNKVMTAIYINNMYQVQPMQSPAPQYSSACQILSTDGSTVTIINMYYPDSLKQQDQISWLHNIHTVKTLIVGDFNAHHEWWEGPESNADTAGRLLSDAILQSNLCLLNDGTPTRLPDRITDKPTAIDITLASPDIYSRINWIVETDPLGSDHLPITIISEDQNLQVDNEVLTKFNYNKADWNLFKKILESTDYPKDNTDIEEWYDGLRDKILHAASLSIPTSKHKKNNLPPPNPWWNESCKLSQKEYRSALTKYRKNQNDETFKQMKELKIKHKHSLAKAKMEYWSNYLNDNIVDYRDSTKLWKKLKKINQRYNPPERPLLTAAGTLTKNNQEKANLLAETFAKASQTSSLSPEQQQYRVTQEATLQDPVPRNQDPINKSITLTELNLAIDSVKKKLKKLPVMTPSPI